VESSTTEKVPAVVREPEYALQQPVTRDTQTIQGLQRVHRQIQELQAQTPQCQQLRKAASGRDNVDLDNTESDDRSEQPQGSQITEDTPIELSSRDTHRINPSPVSVSGLLAKSPTPPASTNGTSTDGVLGNRVQAGSQRTRSTPELPGFDWPRGRGLLMGGGVGFLADGGPRRDLADRDIGTINCMTAAHSSSGIDRDGRTFKSSPTTTRYRLTTRLDFAFQAS
jgi:hypothetical protein